MSVYNFGICILKNEEVDEFGINKILGVEMICNFLFPLHFSI